MSSIHVIAAAVMSAVVLVLPQSGPSQSLAELTCSCQCARTCSLLGWPGGWPVPGTLVMIQEDLRTAARPRMDNTH